LEYEGVFRRGKYHGYGILRISNAEGHFGEFEGAFVDGRILKEKY
jgi:hypothetical protein